MPEPDCWARTLGGCSPKKSREHLVSKSLFQSPEVRVEGFPWCKDEPKVVGLASLVGKVLCEAHNNQLSPLDQEGAAAFAILREAQRLQNVRGRLKPRRWLVKRHTVNGARIEAWFAKTAINLALSGRSDLRWEHSDTPLNCPPEIVVRVCFGLEVLPPFMGLYSAAVPGIVQYSDDTVGFAPLIRNNTHIAAALFMFRGFQFVLSLIPEQLPHTIDFVRLPDWQGAVVQYYLRDFRMEAGGFLSQSVTFSWP